MELFLGKVPEGTASKTLETQLRKAQAELGKRFVAQGVKLDQAEERLQAETHRGQTQKAAGTIPGADETAEGTP